VEEEYDETAEARRDGMGMGGMVPCHGDEAVENERWQGWKNRKIMEKTWKNHRKLIETSNFWCFFF